MNTKTAKDSQESLKGIIEISLVCSQSDDVATLAVQTKNFLSKHRKQFPQENGKVNTVRVIILCLSSSGLNKNHFRELITRQVIALFPKAETIVNFETK
jgi:hypothetical protein